MNRNVGISLLRVCSMLMIVLCHYSNYIGLSWLAQFLNVGVYTFLLISGWLYSRKTIANPREWILSRWKKLCIPVLVWMFIVIVYGIVIEKEFPPISDILLFATNLQGLSWVLPFFTHIHSDGVLGGLGNLWFVTAIMLCYMMLPAVKKHEQSGSKQNRIVYGIGSIVCFIFLGFFKINLAYFICFMIGYALGKNDNEAVIGAREYIFLSIGMICAIIFRLVAKHFIDGTAGYDVIIVGITHTVIAIWIFFTIRLLDEKIGWIHSLASSKVIQKCDAMSYFIYITHYYFLVRRFGLKNMVPGIPLQTVLFCVLSLATALIVKWISEKILSFRAKKVIGK